MSVEYCFIAKIDYIHKLKYEIKSFIEYYSFNEDLITFKLHFDYAKLGIEDISENEHELYISFLTKDISYIIIQTTVKWWGDQQSEWTKQYLKKVYEKIKPYSSKIALVTDSITEDPNEALNIFKLIEEGNYPNYVKMFELV